MAEHFVNNVAERFFKMSKTFKPEKTSYPFRVDNVEDKDEITDVFTDKVFHLYNSVSYKDIDVLKNEIDILINAHIMLSTLMVLTV